MALNLMQIPTNGGGWFKPADHRGALAILIEPKAFEAQRNTPKGPKDSVVADITIFGSPENLAAGTPTVHQGMRIEQTILARDLQNMIGAATIVRLDQVSTKAGGQAWVWRQVADQSVVQGVVKYAEQRDAAVEEAVASAPSFD